MSMEQYEFQGTRKTLLPCPSQAGKQCFVKSKHTTPSMPVNQTVQKIQPWKSISTCINESKGKQFPTKRDITKLPVYFKHASPCFRKAKPSQLQENFKATKNGLIDSHVGKLLKFSQEQNQLLKRQEAYLRSQIQNTITIQQNLLAYVDSLQERLNLNTKLQFQAPRKKSILARNKFFHNDKKSQKYVDSPGGSSQPGIRSQNSAFLLVTHNSSQSQFIHTKPAQNAIILTT